MINKQKIIISSFLIVFAIVSRLFLRDLPNVETITITALLAGSILGVGYALVIPLTAIAITDIWIGNNSILLFTWSAWVLIGLSGLLLKKQKKDTFRFSLQLTGLGITASLLFFLWTNFGVWLMWPKMYPMTLSGLVQCYVMGLPFLKYNLLGNLVIIPVISFAVVACFKWQHISKSLRKIIRPTN